MNEIGDQFEDQWTHVVYRPQGAVSITEGIDLLVAAVRNARERGIDKLLVDVRQLTGFDPPDFWQRVRMAVRCVEEAQSRVAVAVVATEEMIDPEKIGVQIARNRGMLMDAFTNEQDAVDWLKNPS